MSPERYREIRVSAEAAGREHAEAAIARVTDWARESKDLVPGTLHAPDGLSDLDAGTWLDAANGAAETLWEAACAARGCVAVSPDGWQTEARARETNDAKADRNVWLGAAKTRRYQPSVWGQHRRTRA